MKALLKLGSVFFALGTAVEVTPPEAADVARAPVEMAKSLATSSEMRHLRDIVILAYIDSERLPSSDEFYALARKMTKSSWKDPMQDFWERPYIYREVSGGFEISSAGPDGSPNTRDDLVVQWRADS